MKHHWLRVMGGGTPGGFSPMIATGGDSVYDITVEGVDYRVHEFSVVGSSSFTVVDAGSLGGVEYLVVGGGGGGSWNQGFSRIRGGGGGAGGLLKYVAGEDGNTDTSPLLLQTGTFAITVGGGGAASIYKSDSVAGKSGQNSSIAALVVALGGAHGVIDTNKFSTGGSGGGGSSGGGSLGTPPQGSNGRAALAGAVGIGGGGGGASGDMSLFHRHGVPGKASSVTGASVVYAGGGAGGDGVGGEGGGGDSNVVGGPVDGTNGLGGGGAGGLLDGPSGNGGSGVIIIRYPITDPN